MQPGSSRRAFLAGVLALLIAGLWFCSRIFPWTLDDAYIFFRYAENLALGYGPVFNRGGPRVEGFTSPLWTVLLAAGARLFGGDQLPSIASSLGLFSYIGCLLVLLRCGGLLSAALWCFSTAAVFYSVSGLETVLFVLVVLVFHGTLAGPLPRWVGITAALLAAWVRPEGPWLLVAGGVQLIALGESPKRALTMAVALIAGGLLLLAVRWHFFHDILPNTYYAKHESLSAGLGYVGRALRSQEVVTIVLAGVLGAIFGTRRERAWLLAGIAWVIAVVVEGGDWMPCQRFLQPALALFALSASGLVYAFRGRAIQRTAVVVACILLTAPGIAGAYQAGVLAQDHLAHASEWNAAFVGLIKATHVKSVALIDIGEVGYDLPDVAVLDLDGLTDARLGHMPGGEMKKAVDTNYIFDEWRPEMIVVRILGSPGARPRNADIETESLAERMVLNDPRLARDYDLRIVGIRAFFLRHGIGLPSEAFLPADQPVDRL